MPPRPFSADARDGKSASITLHGDITAAAEPDLDAAYERAVATGTAPIELDFADVDYINSTGIALIVRLLAAARRDGREVIARRLSQHYVEIFRITRLADYVHIVESESSPVGEGHAARAASGGQA